MADFLTIIFYFFVAIYMLALVATIVTITPYVFIIIYPVGIVVFTVLDAFIQANMEP